MERYYIIKSNLSKILKIKNFKLIIKYLYTIICITFMLTQIIFVSIEYYNYPIGVNVNIKSDLEYELPSITICTNREQIWDKNKMNNRYPEINEKIRSLGNFKSEWYDCYNIKYEN